MTRIIVRDNGAKKLLANMRRRPGVTVGVHAADGAATQEGSDLTVADIAGIHEFGLGVPERSWLRDFVDQNRAVLLAKLRDIGKRVARGEDPDLLTERFGLEVVGMIKERIIAGIEPPLAPETLVRKLELTGAPKETPLILFGQFISSIAHRLES